ncbi:MAG: type II toxin-antitoxin system RelB/DinJ family antitoxin [Candidatus Sungbacteria bacterium]|nr:type II toxin-antitoxin system RelB/DinJ family antitoxin [Candidatus Sungbacteria bacterium]
MKTLISIRTDKTVKDAAKKLAQDLGFPLSTLVNSYLKQFIRTREAHFSVAPRMTPELEAIIEEAERDFAQNKNISPAFSSMKAAIRYLHSAK